MLSINEEEETGARTVSPDGSTRLLQGVFDQKYLAGLWKIPLNHNSGSWSSNICVIVEVVSDCMRPLNVKEFFTETTLVDTQEFAPNDPAIEKDINSGV